MTKDHRIHKAYANMPLTNRVIPNKFSAWAFAANAEQKKKEERTYRLFPICVRSERDSIDADSENKTGFNMFAVEKKTHIE